MVETLYNTQIKEKEFHNYENDIGLLRNSILVSKSKNREENK